MAYTLLEKIRFYYINGIYYIIFGPMLIFMVYYDLLGEWYGRPFLLSFVYLGYLSTETWTLSSGILHDDISKALEQYSENPEEYQNRHPYLTRIFIKPFVYLLERFMRFKNGEYEEETN